MKHMHGEMGKIANGRKGGSYDILQYPKLNKDGFRGIGNMGASGKGVRLLRMKRGQLGYSVLHSILN